jgi:ferritin-like metal-binding protein YciE
MDRPKNFGVNTFIKTIDNFVIRKYGTCGRFAYMVGDAVTKKILKLPFEKEIDAEEWICSQLNKKS